jgi:hypothetical protein
MHWFLQLLQFRNRQMTIIEIFCTWFRQRLGNKEEQPNCSRGWRLHLRTWMGELDASPGQDCDCLGCTSGLVSDGGRWYCFWSICTDAKARRSICGRIRNWHGFETTIMTTIRGSIVRLSTFSGVLVTFHLNICVVIRPNFNETKSKCGFVCGLSFHTYVSLYFALFLPCLKATMILNWHCQTKYRSWLIDALNMLVEFSIFVPLARTPRKAQISMTRDRNAITTQIIHRDHCDTSSMLSTSR